MAEEKRCKYCSRKMPRGSYEAERKNGEITGYCCRSMLDCFNRILSQRNALFRVGNQMSNVFFNISQRTQQVHPDDAELFVRLFRLWDSERTRYGI